MSLRALEHRLKEMVISSYLTEFRLFVLLETLELLLVSTSCRRGRGRLRCKVLGSFIVKDHRVTLREQ